MSIVFINCSILPLTNSQYYLIHNLTIFRPNLHWLIYALTRLLCCGDSRLSFCHINTCISMPDISWKQFLSQEQSCQHCSCDKNCFQEMSSAGLEMRQNRFRPELCPGPHWGSLQRSPRSSSWWGGGWPPPPQEPHPSLALRASGFGPMGLAVSSPKGPGK